MCTTKPKDKTDSQHLLALYASTGTEITRYRDREWLNLSLFTAGTVAVTGFLTTSPDLCAAYAGPLCFFLVLLFFANIYYTCYAHFRLSEERQQMQTLRQQLQLPEMASSKEVPVCKIVSDLLNLKNDGCTSRVLSRGFFSHLLPFFIVHLLIVIFAIYLVHHPIDGKTKADQSNGISVQHQPSLRQAPSAN